MPRLCVTVVALVLAWPAAARAGVFELEAQIDAGGMVGGGMFGDRKSDAFHGNVSGFGYGVMVGAELLFIDAWIEHDQYFDGSVTGTWTQFMLGFDVGFALGDAPEGQSSRGFGELGIGIGYGVGTGQQVDPPLDRTEVSDQGVVAQANIDFGYRLNRVLSVGVHVPMQFGYFIKDASEMDVANDLDTHYGAMSVAALLFLRGTISLD